MRSNAETRFKLPSQRYFSCVIRKPGYLLLMLSFKEGSLHPFCAAVNSWQEPSELVPWSGLTDRPGMGIFSFKSSQV